MADIEAKDYHVDTGIVGTKWLFESLAEHGRADLALAQIVNPTYPGYGFWVTHVRIFQLLLRMAKTGNHFPKFPPSCFFLAHQTACVRQ